VTLPQGLITGKMDTLLELNEKYQVNLKAIRQMSLARWTNLALNLGVKLNDREQAAKKLAIREMRMKKEK